MNSLRRYSLWLSVVVAGVVCICVSCKDSGTIEVYASIEQSARISPDYCDTVIPPNIAPLNFRILENGQKFCVKIYAPKGNPVTIYSRHADIIIPPKAWKSLLGENKGGKISYDIFAFDSQKGWLRYQTMTNQIAAEAMDSYLVYRFIYPIYNRWKSIGIYQRNIENYKNTLVLDGSSFNGDCTNCHNFCGNAPETMSVAIRSKTYGNASLVVCGDSVSKVDGAWGYTAWHPSGKLAVYSVSKVRQFFHTTGIEPRDVVDLDSAIVYYTLDSRKAETIAALSERNRLETYPAWSPDGKYLYYCSAPILWEDRNALPPRDYDKVKYDLMRISYDIQTDQWGEPQTVLAAQDTGLSIGLPRISPDGGFVIFAMCDYGCFPVFRPSSDLYRMNLATREYKKLDVIISPYSESWHSFSSNGRWLAFSSKKTGGLFTRTYFAYIDQDGSVYKPFVLPQKDPAYYDSLLETYSVPEFISQPIRVSPRELARAARSAEKINPGMPVTGATPTAQSSEPYQQGQK